MINIKSTIIGLCCIVFVTVTYYEINKEEKYISKSNSVEVDEKMKLTGAYQFAQYHMMIRTAEGKDAPDYESGYRLSEYNRAKSRLRESVRSRSTLDWIERGPGNVAGRTRSLWVDPSDESGMTVLVGSAGGGVWKTSDGGSSWSHLTEGLLNLATSEIVGAPTNPDVLYLGTGENFGSTDEISGSGMWKSTDGGVTWNTLPNTFQSKTFGAVNSILVDPEDEDHIVFSVRVKQNETNGISSFIGSSKDGGNKIDAPLVRESGNIQQLIADPSNFSTLYGTINSTGVIKSTNGGSTWSTVWGTSDYSRMEIAVSPVISDFVYMSAYQSAAENTSAILLSVNGGRNFRNIIGKDSTDNILPDYLSGQGWYDNAITAHPSDLTKFYVGGAGLLLEIKIEDPSAEGENLLATITPLADGYGEYSFLDSKGVHVDHHFLHAQQMGENVYLYGVNDGGFAMSMDGGQTFVQTGDLFKNGLGGGESTHNTTSGLRTGQFYGADKANGIDRYVGGLQDNASWASPIDSDSEADWNIAGEGDGFECAWSYGDQNKFIVSSQFGRMRRTLDGGSTFERVSPPNAPSSNNFPFITRIANSKHEPDLLFSPSAFGIYRSEDFGTNWELISMPSWKNGQEIVRVSVGQPNVVWAVQSNFTIALSLDGGRSFSDKDVNPYEEATRGLVTNVATHPSKDSVAYLLFSQANGPKVVMTEDLGQTYKDLSGFNGDRDKSSNGFPDVATYSLLVMPYNNDIIWVGTDIGLVESNDGGATWFISENGFPNTAIWDMKIVNDEIVMATHGRGVWSVSIPELEGYEPRPVPSIVANRFSLDGIVAGNYKFRTETESAKIIVSYEVEGEMKNEEFPIADVSSIGQDIDFLQVITDLPEDEIIRGNVLLQTVVNGEILNSYSPTLLFNVDADDPISEYENDFDKGQTDFALDGFRYLQPTGFGSKGLDSPHPYPQLVEYLAIFQKPIPVTDETSTVAWDEIVLLEPGAGGSVFGDPDFYDHILIEGTNNNGLSWDTIEGYDSRYNEIWENAYNNGISGQDSDTRGSSELIMRHVINLQDYYDIGDEVYLSFSMSSDPFALGWGWRMDNLNVGNSSVNTIDVVEEKGFSASVITNPVEDNIQLELINTEADKDIRYDIVDLNGRQVVRGKILNSFQGNRVEQIDVHNLPGGLYLVRVMWEGKQRGIRVVKR